MLAHSSYSSLMEDLHDIGAGYMVIAENANAAEILRGEGSADLMSEDIISRLVSLRNDALETIYPRIYRRVELRGREFILTGVYPPNEISAGKCTHQHQQG